MKWTREFPEVNGMYWTRYTGYSEPTEPELHSINGDTCRTETGSFSGVPGRECERWEFLGPITPAQAELWDDLLHGLLHARNRNHEHAPDACTGCEMVDTLLNRAKQPDHHEGDTR